MASVSSRPCRSIRGVNYALYNSMGRKGSSAGSQTSVMAESEYEDGQIRDSPLQIMVDDTNFLSGSHPTEGGGLHADDEDRLLDDTLTHYSGDGEHAEHAEHGTQPAMLGAEESLLSVADHELVQDHVWQQQQEILRKNSQKREQMRIQLARRKELNEAMLREEEECRMIQRMEKDCAHLEKHRLVNVPKFYAQVPAKQKSQKSE